MSEWLLGEMRLAPWQREIADRLLAGEELQLLQSARPTRIDRVRCDALMVIASLLSDKSVTLVGPDDQYAADVAAEIRRLMERLRE